MPKDQYEVDALIEGGTTAEVLLKEAFPKAITTFKKHVDGLNALLKEIRKEFPDANYYLDEDNFNLMLGESHKNDRNESMAQDRSAASETLWNSGGGGW